FHSLGDEVASTRHFERLEGLVNAEFPDYMSLIDAAAWTGRRDEAIEAMMLELGDNPFSLTVFIQSPVLKPLRDDPRWDDMLAAVGYSAEERAKVHFDPELPD
ncbi:MAG: hypothetical protein R3358_15070, partial [Woeseiaceae bacterium]|nr:hypothetical protein [Woeseiaceae bacterium]